MEKLFNLIKKVFILSVKIAAGFAIVLAALFCYYNLMYFVFKSILPKASIDVLSNFILFAGILLFVILKSVRAPEQMTKMQEDIAETIKTSEETKTVSEENLSSIEKSLEHIGEEIDAILANSDDNAKLVGEKLLEDADKAALMIQENSGKIIENKRALLKNELVRRASLASVEVAKSHIIEELEKNPDLHAKLIDESIEAIEGIEG